MDNHRWDSNVDATRYTVIHMQPKSEGLPRSSKVFQQTYWNKASQFIFRSSIDGENPSKFRPGIPLARACGHLFALQFSPARPHAGPADNVGMLPDPL